jgi:flagellar FliL protein
MSSVDDLAMAGFDETGDAGRPARSRKLLIIIAVAILLVASAGGAAYVFLGDMLAGGDGEYVKESPPVFHDMPEIVIRLDGGQGPYMKLATVLDLAAPHWAKEIKAVEPRLLDMMQTYLIELKPEDIKGTAGMYRMRQELLRRINDAVPGSTRDVLFKTLILQ